MFEKIKINDKLENKIKIKYYTCIDSTNLYLKRNINSLKNDTLVVAKKQTKGQGRVGKKFYSQNGVFFSLLLKNIDNYNLDLLTIKVSVAICHVLKNNFNINCKIKWVNDLYYQGYKCAGILCEKVANSIIIGIGINMNNSSFPDNLKDIAIDIPILKKDYAVLISLIINEIYFILNDNGRKIIDEYTNLLIVLNKEINFTLNNITYKGIVKGVNEKGNLIVTSDNQNIVLKSGEISLQSKHIIE